MAQPVWASEHLKCYFRSNWPKCPWSTLGWLKVKVGSKSSQNYIFHFFLHQTWVTQWFSSTLTKFDSRLTLESNKNSNFDLVVRIGWDHCHCEDYQIPFPMTIHRLKSELKRLRYLKKPWKARQYASRGHNFLSSHWIFNFFSVLET